ncbi:hypothetical protein MUP38_05765, partial [Candidatus Bathyarchaeota archaeon]|nr:hypothetical protein [Candidatus Bathyarchaeota archaeon]
PKWTKYANVKISKINNSTIFLFEESFEEHDVFSSFEAVSDLQLFLGLPKQTPENYAFKSPTGKGMIVLFGEHGANKNVVFSISADSMFNAGYVPYHSPIAILNIFINLVGGDDVLATRVIPLAVYVHHSDMVDIESFWTKCTPHIQDTLRYIHNSEEGDYYQTTTEHRKGMLVYKEKSVIVFGKDSGTISLNEMWRVRDHLKTKNYDAYLLRELPEHPLMSNEEKAKLWALASRFCVMIDREPSGHIAEYNYLKGERVILAFLRPKSKGSTYMIGDDGIEVNHIKLFEFETSPLQVLDDAIAWAEEFVRKKIEALKNKYPWRKS